MRKVIIAVIATSLTAFVAGALSESTKTVATIGDASPTSAFEAVAEQPESECYPEVQAIQEEGDEFMYCCDPPM